MQPKKLYILIFYLALIFLSIEVKAQSQNIATLNYSSSKISMDDGLSQGSNYFRFEDSKGFMWLTANDAINRYDGSTIKVYNLNKYFDHCPNLQQGYGFAEDAQSNIYIGSINGLYIYNRKQDKFTLQKIYTNSADDVAMAFAFYQGKIWCFNRQYQLATYDVTSKKIEVIIKLPLQELPSVNPYQLHHNMFYFHMPILVRNGNVYVSTTNQLLCYNIQTKRVDFLLQDILEKQNRVIYTSFYDTIDHTILFATTNGIVTYNLVSKQSAVVNQVGGLVLSLVSYVASSKNLLVLRNKDKIYLADKKFSHYQELSSNKWTSEVNTMGLSFDKDERLWISDNGFGQVIFDFSPKLLRKYTPEHPVFFDFSSMGITRFAEMGDGTVVIPALNRNGNSIDIFLNPKSNDIKLLSVFKHDRYINLILGTDKWNRRVWSFSQSTVAKGNQVEASFLDNGIVEKFLINHSNANDIGVLQSVFCYSKNLILCAFENGLYYFNLQTRTFDATQGGMQKNPFVISPLSKNRIAVSYLSGDMIVYQILSNGYLQKEKTILPGIQSFYMQEDTVKQQYWAGTNQGIFLLDKTFSTLKKFDVNNGLAGNYIYGILLGDDGNLYCSHQHGLSSINSSSGQVINFDKEDGIQDWDYNNRAFLKGSDGTLYFGGASGFNSLKPPLKHFSNYTPQVYIDEILINNKTYSSNASANYISSLALSYDENNIAIKTSIADLANASSRQLIYRFKNKEEQWHYLSSTATILFNSLAPDNYVLQLGYYDKSSGKEIIQKELAITIKAPFYKTIWFAILSTLLVATGIFYYFYSRKINQQKNELEKQAALKNQQEKITADLHDDIGATLSSLQLNSTIAQRYLQKDSTKTNKVLQVIELQAKELAEKLSDMIWSMKPSKEAFGNFSDRIKTYTSQILENSNIDYTLQIEADIDNYIQSTVIKKNLVMIAKEAINNAVKYSKATKINVQAKIVDNKIELVVTDNGIGFEAKDNSGNGLRNMHTRATELQGEININSTLNVGTVVKVIVPAVLSDF
jgi:signal transduction histidine kinase